MVCLGGKGLVTKLIYNILLCFNFTLLHIFSSRVQFVIFVKHLFVIAGVALLLMHVNVPSRMENAVNVNVVYGNMVSGGAVKI